MAVDYEWFKKGVYDLTKIDLNAYKEKQMKRRIDAFISRHGVKGYENFIAEIKKDNALWKKLSAHTIPSAR